LTLVASLCLILFGTWIFFVLEYYNALRGLTIDEKILASLFQSVTPRTAGFNSVDFGTLTEPVLLIWILFMFIGASPGSCGGGIKTTTLAVFFALVRSQLRGEENVNCMHRTLPLQTVSRMVSVMAVGLVVLIVSTILLVYVQSSGVATHSDPRGLFLGYMFEAASAFGTVGLSTGVTALLTPLGKVIIMCLMFLGRVGPLTLALSIQPKEKSRGLRYSEENVMIG
jgi:trk system potassium uptake protein TrkH